MGMGPNPAGIISRAMMQHDDIDSISSSTLSPPLDKTSDLPMIDLGPSRFCRRLIGSVVTPMVPS